MSIVWYSPPPPNLHCLLRWWPYEWDGVKNIGWVEIKIPCWLVITRLWMVIYLDEMMHTFFHASKVKHVWLLEECLNSPVGCHGDVYKLSPSSSSTMESHWHWDNNLHSQITFFTKPRDSWGPNPLLMLTHRLQESVRLPFAKPRVRMWRPFESWMSIWNSECFTRGLCFVILINLFLIKMEFAFDFLVCSFIEHLHILFSLIFSYQICRRPRSLAWTCRTLYQWTWVSC